VIRNWEGKQKKNRTHKLRLWWMEGEASQTRSSTATKTVSRMTIVVRRRRRKGEARAAALPWVRFRDGPGESFGTFSVSLFSVCPACSRTKTTVQLPYNKLQDETILKPG